MATNKNQHFVPQCYLRPFTIDMNGASINLFNIDRNQFIEGAPIKHQCSKDYFYGEDLHLEKALQLSEGTYATALREVLTSGYFLTDAHRTLFRRFWLLQNMRTEAASRRAIEMSEGMGEVIGDEAQNYRLGIKEAVQNAMHAFVDEMHTVDDLKVCLFKNRTSIPFFTSDNPAVLTNRWHLEDKRTRGTSFGLVSAGNVFLLPLSPKILCLGYDGHVYSIQHRNGWVDLRNKADVQALNQHQYLNCRANIFVHDAANKKTIQDAFQGIEKLRPETRHKINYAVLDTQDGEYKRYRVIDYKEAQNHQEAMIHTQTIHAHPSAWPRQIAWRRKGAVFTNDSGLGYMRQAQVISRGYKDFRKVLAR